MNLRRTAAGLVCSLALVGLPFAGSAAAATKDTTRPKVLSGATAHEVYALKPSTAKQVVVTVKVSDNVGVSSVSGLFYRPGDTGSGDDPKHTVTLKRISGTAKNGVWQGTLAVKLGTHRLGSWALKASARDAAGARSGTSGILDRFSVKKYVWIEHWQVEQKSKTTVQITVGMGIANVDDWDEFGGHRPIIEFRKKGSSTWTRQGSPPGVDGGIHYGDMKSPGDGSWRARFFGTSTEAGYTTKEIYVDMK